MLRDKELHRLFGPLGPQVSSVILSAGEQLTDWYSEQELLAFYLRFEQALRKNKNRYQEVEHLKGVRAKIFHSMDSVKIFPAVG